MKEGLDILNAADDQTLQIVDAAWQVRRHYFADTVKVNVLSNAKSGLCAEDCHYCSQSQKADSEIRKYSFLTEPQILKQARAAYEAGGQRFCITMAVRSASWSQVGALSETIKKIKKMAPLEICVCLGLMQGEIGRKKLQILREAGADAYNHNLNTHEENYASICSTHGYEDRLETLRNARDAGFSTCSGVIIGMEETDDQIVDLALTFRRELTKSVPVNFLIPVKGTLQERKRSADRLTPWSCLRVLSLFRLANPDAEIRASAGRELHLKSLQPLALLVANSIFLGGYLTQKGQEESTDWGMIADLGLKPLPLGSKTAS